MARTAPVPNLPPIPGMNPGTFVMGGGAGGGGGRGKGGGGRGGGKGGSGKGEGAGAAGGGKNAGACGQGATGSCTNCSNSFSAGDPVDVLTGDVFSTPKRDLFLPGFFDLEILRSYSTARRLVDGGLGHGWSFNLDWHFEVLRSAVHVRNGAGLDMYFPPLREPGDQASYMGWALMRVSDGYVLRPGNEFFHYFCPDGAGGFQLGGVTYRDHGRLLFRHERGRATRITDSANRTVLFPRDGDGRLRAIVVPDDRGRQLVFARYEYDARGDLVSAVDADGHAWRYAYDEGHRLVRQWFPTGIVFTYRYDAEGRCVETWGEYEGRPDPALADDVPELLAAGQRPARGVLHCALDYGDDDYSEVCDSVRVQRFFRSPGGGLAEAVDGRSGVTTREFDAFGRVTGHRDALGARTAWQYDELGEVVIETDAEGRTVAWSRDEEGRVVEATGPDGGVIRQLRDRHGNVVAMTDQRGGTYQYARDGRGRLVEETDPAGVTLRYAYDAHGNRVSETLANGATTRYAYDYWGRLIGLQTAAGGQLAFRRSPSGLALETVDSEGRRWLKSYDGLGNLLTSTPPDGSTTRLTWGGLGWLCAVEHPDGSRAEARFNREGWVTSVRNEAGATHTWAYDGAGLVTRERSFNGAERAYFCDQRGRTVGVRTAAGRRELAYNHVGQVVSDKAPDGSERRYEYDARGELERVTSPGVVLELRRDPTGEVVAETVRVDGAQYAVETERDGAGRRVGSRTSLGLDARFDRGSLGTVAEIRAEAPVLALERDAAARTVARVLPGGGRILDGVDALGRVRRRHVDPAGAAGASGAVIDRGFDYTPLDELAVVRESGGAVEFTYDVRQHLATRRERGREEVWRADANSNYHEASLGAAQRRYDEGDRLESLGETDYDYDADGYLVEKRRTTPAGVERWRYVWGPWRDLAAVELPDGRRVEFAYDAFSRRVGKRVFAGDGRLHSETHWTWDRLGPVHEVTRGAATGAVATRTFVYEESGDTTPLAQREGGEGAWAYLVNGPTGAPDDLVDGEGRPLARLRRETFGRVLPEPGAAAATPFRFPGQYEDLETGLFYNRHRYYDPEAGRYISPDPIDIEGGHNLYAYGRNPVGWIDPEGLEKGHGIVVIDSDLDALPKGATFRSGDAAFKDPWFHEQARSHSERAMLCSLHEQRVASEKAGHGNPLRGKKVAVRGAFPPCVNCHRAMHAFAQENGMGGIRYEFPDKGPGAGSNSVTYSAGSNPAFAGPLTQKGITLPSGKQTTFAEAYQMKYDKKQDKPAPRPEDGGVRNVNRESQPGGYVYNDGREASQAYTAIKSQVNAPPP